MNYLFGVSNLFQTLSRKLPTQSAHEDIDKDGVLFFGLIGECTLACANTQDEKGYDKIVTDTKLLDFIMTVKVGLKTIIQSNFKNFFLRLIFSTKNSETYEKIANIFKFWCESCRRLFVSL